MDQSKDWLKPRGFVASVVAIALAVTSLVASAQVARADVAIQTLTINASGGSLPDDSDGIAIVINGGGDSARSTPDEGSDEVYLGGLNNWCCGGGGPVLAIPTGEGTAISFGAAGAGNDSNSNFNSVSVSNLTGSARTDGSAAAGAGSADVTYVANATIDSVVHTYTIVRKVTYTNGGLWNGAAESANVYHNRYTISATSGAPSARLYYGGDTAPGGSDVGFGIMQDQTNSASIPSTTVYSLNPDINPGMYIALRQGNSGVLGTQYSTFDAYGSQRYNNPYADINSGKDLGKILDPNRHDAGLQVQFNLGTPGTPLSTFSGPIVRYVDNVVGRYSALKAELASSDLEINSPTTLNLKFETSEGVDTPSPGFTFSFTLPASLRKASNFTSFGNNCFVAGNISWTNNNRTISGTGVKLKAKGDAQDNCIISAAVSTDSTTGDLKLATTDATALFPLINLVSFEYTVSGPTTIDSRVVGGTINSGTGGSVPSPANTSAHGGTGTVQSGEGVEFTSANGRNGNMPDALFLGGRQYGSGQYNSHPVPFLHSDLIDFANELDVDTCRDFTAVYRLYGSPTSESTTVDTAYEATSSVTIAGDPTQIKCLPTTIQSRIVGGTINSGTGGTPPSPANTAAHGGTGTLNPGEGVEFTSVAGKDSNMPDALFLGGRQYGAGEYNDHPVPFLYSDLLDFANELGVDTCKNFAAVYRLYEGETSESTTINSAYEATSTVTIAGDPSQDKCAAVVPPVPTILLPSTGVEADDLSLVLDLAVGANIKGATTLLKGTGLKPGSQYQLIMQSTPKVLYRGKTNTKGNFAANVKIPSYCPGAGQHTLTLIGTKPNGNRTKAVTYLVFNKKCDALAIVQGKKTNKTVKVGGMNFDRYSAKLTPDTVAALKIIAPVIKGAKSVTLEGYTQTQNTSKTSRAANLKLAENRSKNVQKYLKSLGVKAKFVIAPKGAVDPITTKNQAKNRRVEISVRFLDAILKG